MSAPPPPCPSLLPPRRCAVHCTAGAAPDAAVSAGVWLASCSAPTYALVLPRTPLLLATACSFGASMFLSPIFSSIPPYATGPAIVLVGALMFEHARHGGWRLLSGNSHLTGLAWRVQPGRCTPSGQVYGRGCTERGRCTCHAGLSRRPSQAGPDACWPLPPPLLLSAVDWEDLRKAVPAFLTIILMPLVGGRTGPQSGSPAAPNPGQGQGQGPACCTPQHSPPHAQPPTSPSAALDRRPSLRPARV